MIRRSASIVVCSLSLGLLIAGCQGQKTADQQAPGGPDASATSSSSAAMSSRGKGKRTAAMVGGGAAGGAAIGGIAGGGKGAAIGALIGAAAGTGGAGLTGNRDITLSAETPLDFKLLQSVKIREK